MKKINYQQKYKEYVLLNPNETKICLICQKEKPLKNFRYSRKKCKKCEYTSYEKQYKKYYLENKQQLNLIKKQNHIDNQENYLYKAAKSRAKRLNIPFNLEISDIIIPEYCPILGIKLTKVRQDFKNRDYAPSIDRFIPELGYIKGNVFVISFRANYLKNNATIPELESVINYIKFGLNRYSNYSGRIESMALPHFHQHGENKTA